MRVGIMQPYFLPYIGYWQLIGCVDYFVVLDDVNYISRGWINRNRIVVNGRPFWLTIPLQKSSQNKLINELLIQGDDGWKHHMLRTLSFAYSKAELFPEIFRLFSESLELAEGNLSRYLSNLIYCLSEKLCALPSFIPTSAIFSKGQLKGQDRILDICVQLGASEYVNLPGGRALYDEEKFYANRIKLQFLEQPKTMSLSSGLEIEGSLSILDTLMHNSLCDVRRSVADYRFAA